MTDRISLTSAELAFLLSVSGTTGSPAPDLLGFTDADRTDQVIAAGLGSLLLRHLVAPGSGQQVELAPELVAVTEGLARPRICVQVGLVADQTADGALLFESGIVRFLLAPRAYRCFDVTGVDPAVDRRDPLLDLARPFLESHRPGVASFTAHSAQVQNAWVTVSSNPDGRWSFVSGADPDAALSGLTPDAAIDHVRIELGVLLPEFSPAS
jgi:hypothetical protein